jgi:hypothetical protein
MDKDYDGSRFRRPIIHTKQDMNLAVSYLSSAEK